MSVCLRDLTAMFSQTTVTGMTPIEKMENEDIAKYFDDPSVVANAETIVAKNKWADNLYVTLNDLGSRLTYMATNDGQLHPLWELENAFDKYYRPRNPVETTNRLGRWKLGKWGPNHAADPVITYRDWFAVYVLVIIRSDTTLPMPALPGGMVDAGEAITRTLIRELNEEAVESSEHVVLALANGTTIHAGYVYDPRNTDNAWIESTVVHAHLDKRVAKSLKLRPAFDGETTASYWIEITPENVETMYTSSHKEFVMKAYVIERKMCVEMFCKYVFSAIKYIAIVMVWQTIFVKVCYT